MMVVANSALVGGDMTELCQKPHGLVFPRIEHGVIEK